MQARTSCFVQLLRMYSCARGAMKKRHIDLETAMQNTYLDLITDYLAKELDPLKAAEVERQLETDPAFRDFAAPIVAAWNARRRPR
jgi:hypothetical protein